MVVKPTTPSTDPSYCTGYNEHKPECYESCEDKKRCAWECGLCVGGTHVYRGRVDTGGDAPPTGSNPTPPTTAPIKVETAQTTVGNPPGPQPAHPAADSKAGLNTGRGYCNGTNEFKPECYVSCADLERCSWECGNCK